MSSTLTNSLLLLNEIRDQLKQSKAPTSKDNFEFQQKDTSSYRKAGNDYETAYSSITTEEEPLRVQLNRKVNSSLRNSPNAASKKIRIEDEAENWYTESDLSKSQHKNIVSPNKRKRGQVSRETEEFSLEKFTRRSQNMAENLKRLINEEIESFSSECDNLRNRLQNMIEDKQGRGNIENIGSLKSSARSGEFMNREESSELKLHQITSKIERLMEDIDDKKL